MAVKERRPARVWRLLGRELELEIVTKPVKTGLIDAGQLPRSARDIARELRPARYRHLSLSHSSGVMFMRVPQLRGR